MPTHSPYRLSECWSVDNLLKLSQMLNSKDKVAAVRVYTVCDESRYLIVRNVPSINCREELLALFASYGPVEECCLQTDGERCESFTEVYRIKFQHVDNARFAKRKLDEFAFYGNLLQVSYAPQFEALSDTQDKLEGRRREVLARIRQRNNASSHQTNLKLRKYPESAVQNLNNQFSNHISSDKDYFSSPSMNRTVKTVREKLDKIASSGEPSSGPVQKKSRTDDNRRRI